MNNVTGCIVNNEDFVVALHPPQVMVPVGNPGVEHCTCHPGCFVMVVLNSQVYSSDMISENIYILQIYCTCKCVVQELIDFNLQQKIHYSTVQYIHVYTVINQ